MLLISVFPPFCVIVFTMLWLLTSMGFFQPTYHCKTKSTQNVSTWRNTDTLRQQERTPTQWTRLQDLVPQFGASGKILPHKVHVKYKSPINYLSKVMGFYFFPADWQTDGKAKNYMSQNFDSQCIIIKIPLGNYKNKNL